MQHVVTQDTILGDGSRVATGPQVSGIYVSISWAAMVPSNWWLGSSPSSVGP